MAFPNTTSRNNTYTSQSQPITNYTDCVDRANKVMIACLDERKRMRLTTSQLRNFLSLVVQVRNKVEIARLDGQIEGDRLPDSIAPMILNLRARLVYQMARERAVKDFVEIADLEKDLQEIGTSYRKFKEFTLYVEALVAYHKLRGGKEQEKGLASWQV